MKGLILTTIAFYSFSAITAKTISVDIVQKDTVVLKVNKEFFGNRNKNASDTLKEDTNRVKTLNKESWQAINIGNYDKGESLTDAALSLSKKLHYKKGIADAYNNLATIYYDKSDYPKAMTSDLTSLKIREEIGDKKGTASSYNNIGLVFWQQRDSINTLKYFDTALKIDKKINNQQNMASVYGNIAMVYILQKKYDKAIKNTSIGLKLNQELGNKMGMAIAYGNLAVIYMYQDNYSDAEKNLFLGLAIHREIANKQGMCTIFTNLGYLFTTQKKYTKAKEYIDTAIIISKGIGNKETIRDAYNNLASLDSNMGLFKAAFNDYKIYIQYKDTINNNENTQKIVSEQMNFEFDKKSALEKVEQEKREIMHTEESTRKNIIAFGTIVILVIALISAWLLIKGEQEKRKKDKIIFENNLAISEQEKGLLKLEKEHAELERQYAEEELQNAKITLDEYTQSMVKKNQLLEQFKSDIEKLKDSKSKELDEERIKQLEHLNKATILTKEDWDKFKRLFEHVHTGYFTRLKEKMPDLTQAETRLVCLTKLELDTKQMAGILGVSYDTIAKTRYRLRKKMGLKEADNIDDIAESI